MSQHPIIYQRLFILYSSKEHTDQSTHVPRHVDEQEILSRNVGAIKCDSNMTGDVETTLVVVGTR